MNPAAHPLLSWIATELGMRIRDVDQPLLWSRILTRVKAQGLSSPDAYYQFLSSGQNSPRWQAEWREFVNLLTVTESYFFRDQGQFGLLRQHIVPNLIQRKQELNNGNPYAYQRSTLRVWSAGCSTGEEAYSLAILLKELVPNEAQWDVVVIGTDVNPAVLERARRGVYSDWSFRTVDPKIKQQYFRSHRGEWEIDPQIRRLVRFQTSNLVQDEYPSTHTDLYNFDLILCRNVFIYFSVASIALVLGKFYNTLAPGGYLMTGHTELQGQQTGNWQLTSFPESVVYQRGTEVRAEGALTYSNSYAVPSENSSESSSEKYSNWISSSSSPCSTNFYTSPIKQAEPPVQLPAQPNPSAISSLPAIYSGNDSVSPNTIQQLHATVSHLVRCKANLEAVSKAKELLVLEPNHFSTCCLMAEAYANMGNYLQAAQACQQAIQINSLAADPYYLLAQISEEQGDLEGAKIFLKRVIYLSPAAIPAYLELGSLYEQEGNLQKAKRAWQSALDLLLQVSQQTIVDSRRNLTAKDLRTYIESNLKK